MEAIDLYASTEEKGLNSAFFCVFLVIIRTRLIFIFLSLFSVLGLSLIHI